MTDVDAIQSLPVAATAVLWMAFSIVIVVFPSTPAPDAADMNYTVVVLAAWLALCVAYYYCPVYGGVYWFQGPVSNVVVSEPHTTQAKGCSVLPGLSSDSREDSTDTIHNGNHDLAVVTGSARQ